MPDLILRSTDPLNAEPPLARLRQNFITTAQNFYIRSHGPIPRLHEKEPIRIGGLVEHPSACTAAELTARFAPCTVMAVLQCAGNRRGDLQATGKTSGDPWSAGAIGNAEWSGVRLADVLAAAGVQPAAKHVLMEAHDDARTEDGCCRYGASIPLDRVNSGDVLLATHMNREPLAPEHGAPLRVIVPGYAGVRSVKWLASITLGENPSQNHFQQRDYKLFPPDVTQKTADWDSVPPINEMPVNAAICTPEDGARLQAGPVEVRGYAVAGDRAVMRAEVSADGGAHWHQASLSHEGGKWAWTFWSLVLDLPAGEHILAVRAWDEAGQTQPSNPKDVWNFRGYLCTSWHRVRLTLA